MRIEVLSDHPSRLRQQAAAPRLARQAARNAEYAAAVARVEEQRDRRRQARMTGKWLEVVRLSFAVAAARRRIRVPFGSVADSVPSDTEAIAEAGKEAEDRVAAALDGALGREWVLFRGYRNRRGEIDGVLAGPGGIFAIEVKAVNGVVTVDADTWYCDRYDSRGRYLRREPLPRNGGPSPSRQVNMAADTLAAFLARRHHPHNIRRVVVLEHPKAEVGTLANLTVDAVGTSAEVVLSLIAESGTPLNARNQAAVEQLIRKDHEYNNSSYA
jgi:hypothetical protein